MLNHLLLINFRFIDLIDILFVAVLIYFLYNIIKGTVAIRIFFGILSIYLIWKIVNALQMQMLSEILGQFIGVGVIALLIVFQPELRKFLLFIGNREIFKGNSNNTFVKRILNVSRSASETDYTAVVDACKRMGKTKTGALIVVARTSDPELFIQSQTVLDGKMSSALLESIFYKNSPLHDGAVLIKKDRIHSARGVLPVSENPDLDPNLGMRHRAALGIAESTDAIAITVSEETGLFSYASNGQLYVDVSAEELLRVLEDENTVGKS